MTMPLLLHIYSQMAKVSACMTLQWPLATIRDILFPEIVWKEKDKKSYTHTIQLMTKSVGEQHEKLLWCRAGAWKPSPNAQE